MFAAEHDGKLVVREYRRGHPADLRHDVVQVVEGQLHLGKRVNADGVNIRPGFLVPELEVCRGDEDLARAVSSARHV
jgi:hypothetical protein